MNADDQHSFDDLRARLAEAAIQAELDTGEHEETIEEARAHITIRLARISLGIVVTLLGIALLPLPGPGWLVIAGGLFILAKDVAWADRLLTYVRRKVPGIPEDGKIPHSSIATMAVFATGAVALSLWWTLGRG